MAVTVTHTASFEYTAVDTDHDEAGVAIGTAAVTRIVFVAVSGLIGLTGEDINTLSIGGIAATRVRRDQFEYVSAGFFNSSEIWWAVVPTGTTATISFTHDANYSNAKFSVYAVTGADNTTPVFDSDFATRTDALTNALSVSVDVPDTGGAIGLGAGVLRGTSVTAAWTYLTENLDNDLDIGGIFEGFSTASISSAAAATGQAVTVTSTGTGTDFGNERGLTVITIRIAAATNTAGSSAGTGTATGAARAVASSPGSATATGAATAVGASIAFSAASASGSATATAVGEASGAVSADGLASGQAEATAVTAVVASVAGSATGAALATAVAFDSGLATEAVTYPPVGGGGGIAPPYYSEQQRFRIRKEKSKPRVYVIKTGNWPTEEELARAEREEQREFSRFVNGIQPNRAAPVESDDEEELVAILSMLA